MVTYPKYLPITSCPKIKTYERILLTIFVCVIANKHFCHALITLRNIAVINIVSVSLVTNVFAIKESYFPQAFKKLSNIINILPRLLHACYRHDLVKTKCLAQRRDFSDDGVTQ